MPEISKVLIANRGEIACRVIRTCRNMGIKTVAIYSTVDENTPHVKDADESVCIGPPESIQSYLNMDKIINVAKKLKCDAIHPGYGFLSENSLFSSKCKDAGIIFIGPNAESIEAIGSKMGAKNLLSNESSVPLIPGYNGKDQSLTVLVDNAIKIGFPVLIKASAGGGGKGMRVVRNKDDLASAIESAKTEASNSFGDDKVLIEKYFEGIRHIEIQIFGDTHGNVIHLFERECSVQRRHQKVIEESPSPVLPNDVREKMCAAAIKIGKLIKYVNAGTVEFIYDEKTQKFYFLEVNTRLQVEHPVTEYVTGLDLVRLQIEIARGKSLKDLVPSVKQSGHAVECRLYAEDPENNFFPCPGTVLKWTPHRIDGSRFDTGIVDGTEISVYYDPMISKVITYAENRAEALDKMVSVLLKTVVLGPVTNKDFLVQILSHQQFRRGNFDTMFIDKHFEHRKRDSQHLSSVLIAATMFEWCQNTTNQTLLVHTPSGWRNSPHKMQTKLFEYKKEKHPVQYSQSNNRFTFIIDKESSKVEFFSLQDHILDYSVNDVRQKVVILKKQQDLFLHSDKFGDYALTKKSLLESQGDSSSTSSDSTILGDVPGKILKILVMTGDKVKRGQALIVVESMKMENKRYATKDGVATIHVKEGQLVSADTVLVTLE